MGWNSTVEFDWDAANAKHLARHKITREEVEEIFANEPAIVDYEFLEQEDRWSAVGATHSLRVLVIVFTVRGERIRPVTGWVADRRTGRNISERGARKDMAKKRLLIPSFQSEAQEARWWDRHRRSVEAELRRRLRRGSTHTLAEVMEGLKKKSLKPVTIRMRSDDIETARGLAARKGIGYQTYIKLLLREALDREVIKQRHS